MPKGRANPGDVLKHWKQKHWVGYLVAAAAIVAGIAAFTDSVAKISDNVEKLFGTTARTKTLKLAFDSGWILAGYYDPSTQTYTQVPYVEIAKTSYPQKQMMPRVGDWVRVTGERNVIIADYASSGTSEQMNPPLRDLAPGDYTGVKLPSGTVMEVRDVGGGSYVGRPTALWLRVAGIPQ